MKSENEKINKAIEHVTQEYLSALIKLMSLDPDQKEVNFFKTVIDIENGGKYLLHLQHIEGPKIELQAKVDDGGKECKRCGLQFNTKGCSESYCKHFHEDLDPEKDYFGEIADNCKRRKFE